MIDTLPQILFRLSNQEERGERDTCYVLRKGETRARFRWRCRKERDRL